MLFPQSRDTSKLGRDVAIKILPRLFTSDPERLENHAAAVALHYMHYNFARIHKMLRVTPAMAADLAGVTCVESRRNRWLDRRSAAAA